MMPRLDGFGLLEALRDDPTTETLPVIMLSARAGEEARIEGLDAGADDYLIKPFGARELLARVNTLLEMARIRKQAADEVKSERERFYSLLMHAPAGVAVLTGPDFRFELANPHYRRLVGVKRDIDGKPLLEAIPDIEPHIMEIMRSVVSSGKRVVANELPVTLDWDNSGTVATKYLNIIYEPLVGEDGQTNGIMVFLYEVTQQIEARQKIEDSEARFRTLIEQSADAVQLVTPEGMVLYSSDSVKSVLGYTPEEIQGVNVAPYIHPDDAKWFSAKWARLLKKPKARTTLQYRVKHKDGSWVWVETTATNHLDTPNIKAVVGNFRNITERKRVEEQLRASEERLRFMAESMPQMIFTVAPDGQLTYFNPQWQQYTGIPVEELKRNPQARRDMVHPDDLQGARDIWKNAFETGSPLEYEYRLRRKDGEYRWFISRVVPMKNDMGDIVMWIGSSTDIHDMKQATERRHELEVRTAALTEQRAQLMALNQAKDEFISLASHQLRTPATGVKQYLGMLLQGYAGEITDDQRAFLQTAYESNERQIMIVNDLLQVARIDAGKVTLRPVKTDIVRLVKSVVNEQASRFAERRQKLVLRTVADDLTVHVDADRIRMVLDNIVDNASKYTEHGKAITITVRAKGKRALIAVADQGVGMADEDIDKIFQKFSRLENPQAKGVEGSGLGLYWAKKIIDLHGGDIVVRSQVGKGTTFTISLPL
jgi:hypothetical protein